MTKGVNGLEHNNYLDGKNLGQIIGILFMKVKIMQNQSIKMINLK